MSIEPRAYWHDDVLEQEYQRIFARGFYAGGAQRLRAEGDYSSYQVCGRPIVTRNIDGKLRSFENICLHRANLIDPPGCGNRPFRCAYHAWQYDADGALERAPMSNKECIGRRQLQSYATIENHGLVFVAPEGELDPGMGVAALDAIGFEPGEAFHSETLVHQANWKFLVENVVEAYHVSFVHDSSFVPTGITSTSRSASRFFGCDSCVHITNKNQDASKGRLIPGATGDYLHAYIFPNLFVSITGGLVGFISHFKPQAAGQTVLEWELFETPLLMVQRTAIRNYIKQQAIDFTRKVLAEDLVVLNNSQVGIRHARGPHQLQEIEGRLAHFHQTYLRMMS